MGRCPRGGALGAAPFVLSALSLLIAAPVFAQSAPPAGGSGLSAPAPSTTAAPPAHGAPAAPTQGAVAAPTTTATPPPPPAVPAPAPDVVLRNDGGMLRGTIDELVPHDHVTLTLPDGETRTIPMSQVRYAGPASRMPTTAAPPSNAAATSTSALTNASSAPSPVAATHAVAHGIEVDAAQARVDLTSDQPDVTFYVQTEQGTEVGVAIGSPLVPVVTATQRYRRLCTAPCRMTLPAGAYTLGLGRGSDSVLEDRDPISLRGRMGLRGHVDSRAGVRTAGWVVLVTGIVAAVVLGSLAAADVTKNPDPVGWGLLSFGVGVSAVSAGAVMAITKDHPTIDVTPGG